MRAVSAEMIAALRAADRRIAVLAAIEWLEGVTVRLWTGVGALAHDGASWAGQGTIAKISGIEYTAVIGIQPVSLVLTGVPADAVIDIPTTSIRGLTARLWLAALTPAETVIGTWLMATLSLDTAEWEMQADGSATLKLTTIAGIWQHERPTARAWTAEEQARIYPGDTGFDHATSIAGKTLKWTKT